MERGKVSSGEFWRRGGQQSTWPSGPRFHSKGHEKLRRNMHRSRAKKLSLCGE